MNRTKWLLATAMIFGVLGVGLWLLWLRIAAINSVFLTTTSPAQTYTVRISGRQNRPRLPVVTHMAWFSVTRGSEAFLVNEYLHSGDWLDPSFDIAYPQQNWPSENVLHLFREESFSGGEPNRIIVKNSSGESLKYLLVVSIDAHLLLDVRPKSQIELKVPPQRGDVFFVSVEGQFNDGHAHKRVGQNCAVNKQQQPPTCYVDIGAGGATFASAGSEQYPSK